MMTIIIIISLLLLPHLTFTAHVGIVNGKEAKPHSRPYMVSIQMDGKHICGGFLISTKFVLTAAHCWCQGDFLTVVVGAHDLSKIKYSDHIGVQLYIKHSEYRSHPALNDIMLLQLQREVELNSNVGLISLPKDGEAGVRCSVAGWGRLETKGSSSNRLMEANMTIKTDAYCSSKWKNKYVAERMICAHGYGGSCKGDSGGPLVCEGKAYGVTSFSGFGVCNSPDNPTVYTKISAYLPWINNIIKNVK